MFITSRRAGLLALVPALLLLPRSGVAVDAERDDPQDARYDDRTFALDEDGWWEVSDFSEPVNRTGRLIYVDQTPPAGERHFGLRSPTIEVLYVDAEHPEEGIQTHRWPQVLLDETPPTLEIELVANLEPSISPGGATMFVVRDGEELRVGFRIVVRDAVDSGIVPAAWVLDGDLEDVPVPLVYDDADGWWEQDDDDGGLLLERTSNWISVEAADRSGNVTRYSKYVEIHDEPFHSAEVEVQELVWEEIGEDELRVSGRLRLTSEHFDVADLHPDTISLYFTDEDGRGLDPLELGVSDGCCDGIPERPVVRRSAGSRPGLVIDFTRWFDRLPGAIDVMGRSTWEDRRFMFLGATDATWRSALRDEGEVVPDDGDPPPPDDDPPDARCKAVACLVPGTPCNVIDSSGGYCADVNYPGAFYAYAIAQTIVQGGKIWPTRGHAEDRCDANAEEAVASCSGEGHMAIRTIPAGCAAGPLTVTSRPGGRCECDVKKGESYAVIGIRFDPHLSTADPAVRSAVAAGGVHCIPKEDASTVGVTFPGGGFSFPFIIPKPRRDSRAIVADPPLVYTYACRSDYHGLVTGAASIRVYANDKSLYLFDWSRARAESSITETRVSTKITFAGVDCETGDPVCASVEWE